MEDLIKRSDAIDELMHIIPYKRYHNGEYVFLLDKRECLAAIKAIPSADRPQEWIPCSERLPEEEGEYLVTARKYAFDSSYYDVQIAYCSPNKKWFRISNCEIVAWMPRPKPWRGADDE